MKVFFDVLVGFERDVFIEDFFEVDFDLFFFYGIEI